MSIDARWYLSNRLGGLRRFAIAITALNLVGHGVLGFEQSWAQPLVALLTAYSMEMGLEVIDAWAGRRRPRFVGGPLALIHFLLPAHITGLAVAMLIYPNERLWPIAFAVAVAIASKSLLRLPTTHGSQHFLNPSNFGISVTLLIFSWVGIAPPYHFTENVVGIGDWVLPGVIIVSGTFINTRFTHRLPLILTWLAGFVLQALGRSMLFGTPVVAAMMPMSGLAFLLYTFYMITDPATTPPNPAGQVLFGAAVAAVYGLLVSLHVVFGLFFALTVVCALRGMGLAFRALAASRSQAKAAAELRAGTPAPGVAPDVAAMSTPYETR